MKPFGKAAEIQAFAPELSWFAAQNPLIRRFFRHPPRLFRRNG
jgi:hypothetical protein